MALMKQKTLQHLVHVPHCRTPFSHLPSGTCKRVLCSLRGEFLDTLDRISVDMDFYLSVNVLPFLGGAEFPEELLESG